MEVGNEKMLLCGRGRLFSTIYLIMAKATPACGHPSRGEVATSFIQ